LKSTPQAKAGERKTKTNEPENSSMQEQQNIKERDMNSAQAGWKRWLNYQSIVKQVPFFLFLALLAVVYIYNGHYADKTIRKINRTAKEVKELKYEYIAVKSKVMFQSKQSELVKSDAIQQLGLKELTESPVVLKDDAQAEK
jgi:Bacteriodetes cell division protein (FtsL-like)